MHFLATNEQACRALDSPKIIADVLLNNMLTFSNIRQKQVCVLSDGGVSTKTAEKKVQQYKKNVVTEKKLVSAPLSKKVDYFTYCMIACFLIAYIHVWRTVPLYSVAHHQHSGVFSRRPSRYSVSLN